MGRTRAFFEESGFAKKREGVWLLAAAFFALTGPWARAKECDFLPSLGQQRVVVILINFSDTTPTYTPAQFTELFFGTTVSTFRHYYREVSYHQFDVTGDVAGWFTASMPHTYYANNQYGRASARMYPKNTQGLVAEAVDLAEAAGVDFSLYDNSGDGCVDALIVVHQGQGGERIYNPNYIWSNVSALTEAGGQARYYDGKVIDRFIIIPEVSYKGDRIVEAGPAVHEFGHLLGLMDLYDKDNTSRGIGIYDAMGAGVWGGDFESPERPVHFSAYNKIFLGWITPLLVSGGPPGRWVLPLLSSSPSCLKIPADPRHPEEYFLVENRGNSGYDALLPSRGLLISHVDERSVFENRDELIGCGDFMPRVAVEQADGRYDLEKKLNWGDSTDLFPRPDGAAREFHSATVPSSLNHQCRLSGVSITQIGDPGDTVSLVVATRDFRPVSPSPAILLSDFAWDELAGDGDLHLESGEEFLPRPRLFNNGGTAQELRATLSTDSPYLLLGNTILVFPDLGPGDSTSPLNSVHLTVLPGYRTGVSANFNIGLVFAGGSTELVQPLRLGQPDLLYVDDDGGDVVDRQVSYCLSSQGYFYDIWNVAASGEPSLLDLLPYTRVLWLTGYVDDSPLSPAELSALSGFLENGGKLVLSSSYLLLDPAPAAAAFASQYLKVASFTDDRYALDYLVGVTDDPASHDENLFLFKPTLFYFPAFNRTIGLTPAAGAAGCMLNDRNHYTALRYPASAAGAYQTLFMSFGLETIHRSELSRFLRRMLSHFAWRPGKPYVLDISPNYGRPKEVDLAVNVTGLNFTPDTQFLFPDGEITVTSQTYVGPNDYKITVNVSLYAGGGWHDLLALAADGTTIRSENMFQVGGPPLSNKTPVADAGEDQVVSHGWPVSLDGRSSRDPDYDPLTFRWQQMDGPLVSLLPGNTAPLVTFQPRPDYLGNYVFKLTVSDPWASDSDTVVITAINQPPVAVQGPDTTAVVGETVALDGRASYDLDGDPLFYLWTQTAGDTVSLDLADSARPTFLPAVPGNYLFSLQVHDSFEVSPNADSVEIIVTFPENHIPVADAGPDQITSWWNPDPVQLDGRLSMDGDGDTLTYQWTILQKPPTSQAVLSDPHSPTPLFDDERVGQYVIELRVYDGEVWSFPDVVSVFCEGQDNDGDGIPDFLDPDDDNDLMPDTWETQHGFNPLDPADGDPNAVNPLTDPDQDGNPAVHEYFNGSNPRTADAHTCGQALGGCFFGDGSGDFVLDPVDVTVLLQLVLGMGRVREGVYPGNGHTMDVNGNGTLDAPDVVVLKNRILLANQEMRGVPALMTLLSPGFSVSANVGDTVRISVAVWSDPLKSGSDSTPRSGTAVLFAPLGQTASLFGGEADLPPRQTQTALRSVNSGFQESVFFLSRDEKEIVVGSDRPGGQGGFDLYLAGRTSPDQNFSSLLPITAVNTTADESSAALSGDGLELYFSRRTEVSWDIYRAARPDRNSPFANPLPLAELNTTGYEYGPSLTDDGLTIYFCRYTSQTGYNIYRATRPDRFSQFQGAAEVSELNSVYYENLPSVNGENTKIYFFSARPASRPGFNLWFAERASPSLPFSAPVELKYVNTYRTETQAWESPDGFRLYYASYNFEDGADMNIYLVRRPSLEVPFFVSFNTGRYEVTGEMNLTAAPDSGGRAQIVVQPRACGDFPLAVYSPPDPGRGYPSLSLPGLVRINVPCP